MVEAENRRGKDAKEESLGVCGGVKNLFSINSLKVLYLYTIGSCIPLKCSSQCLPPTDKSQTEELEGSGAPRRKVKQSHLESKTVTQILIDDGRELAEEKRMKAKVNLHFENHIQKWKRLHFPWKLIFHILLVFLVTAQVAMFANDNSKFTKFLIKNKEAFEHYFKQTKWNQDIDKLYTLQDVYDQITVIVDSYYNVSRQAVGSFSYVNEDGNKSRIPPTLTMMIDYYDIGCGKDESDLFPYNGTLTWYTDLFPDNNNAPNSSNASCCDTETTNSSCSLDYCDCSVEDQINCYINENNLNRINRIAFSFTLSSFFRNHIIENEGPVHAKFHIQITLLSDLYSSMTVDIEVDSKLRRYCYRNYIKASTIVDGVIMILLFFSSLTYIASIIRTYLLVKELRQDFEANKVPLSCGVACGLYNKWYMFMLFTNILMITAIIMKIVSEYQEEISILMVDIVRILLGIGIFVLLCGIFGLHSYFKGFDELFSTIQIAFPRVWRLAVCIVILFIAFTLTGWLVLGPYDPKFDDVPLSMERLYCMLNGDGIYSTFEEAQLNAQSLPVKVFSELYLVFFIFVFVYIVLSMFVGIFDHAHATLSKNATHGTLRQWAEAKSCNIKSAPPVSDPVPSTESTHHDDQDDRIYTEEDKLITNDILTRPVNSNTSVAKVDIEHSSTITKSKEPEDDDNADRENKQQLPSYPVDYHIT